MLQNLKREILESSDILLSNSQLNIITIISTEKFSVRKKDSPFCIVNESLKKKEEYCNC